MGEIKSTLELALERTKHLTLSEQEREAQKRGELKVKTAGLLQKYEDKILRNEQLRKELAELQEAYGMSGYTFLSNAIVERLGLDRDNGPLLVLLKEFADRSVTEFELIVQQYRDAVQSATHRHNAKAKQDLEEKHGVSGSAVAPNLDADEGWQAELRRIKDEFEQRLEEEKNRFKGN